MPISNGIIRLCWLLCLYLILCVLVRKVTQKNRYGELQKTEQREKATVVGKYEYTLL